LRSQYIDEDEMCPDTLNSKVESTVPNRKSIKTYIDGRLHMPFVD